MVMTGVLVGVASLVGVAVAEIFVSTHSHIMYWSFASPTQFPMMEQQRKSSFMILFVK